MGYTNEFLSRKIDLIAAGSNPYNLIQDVSIIANKSLNIVQDVSITVNKTLNALQDVSIAYNTTSLNINVTQVPTTDASFNNGDYIYDASLFYLKANDVWTYWDASLLF